LYTIPITLNQTFAFQQSSKSPVQKIRIFCFIISMIPNNLIFY